MRAKGLRAVAVQRVDGSVLRNEHRRAGMLKRWLTSSLTLTPFLPTWSNQPPTNPQRLEGLESTYSWEPATVQALNPLDQWFTHMQMVCQRGETAPFLKLGAWQAQICMTEGLSVADYHDRACGWHQCDSSKVLCN